MLKRLCAHNGAVKVLGDDAVRFLAVTTAPPIAWHTLQYQLTQCSPSDRPPRATLSNFYAPRRYPVGITSATAESRCSIAGARWGRRFASRPINRFLASLFEELPEALAGAGLQKVDLSRFDLHHAHVFATNDALGLLFHACEYPAYCDQHFPVNLGFCQAGSTVAYAIERMRWRNIVW